VPGSGGLEPSDAVLSVVALEENERLVRVEKKEWLRAMG
jgi:hypothetical protein